MILRKKSLIFIAAFFVFIFAWAESSAGESVSEETRYQFIQPFKWKSTENAKSYEINVESFDNGEWVKEASVRTKRTSIQLPLYPGQKRVSITSLNRLGRRGRSTEWAEFVVLGETQPYLYADYLKKSIQWESPVLRVTSSESERFTDNISSENGDPEHSFFLKGKNIFLSETKFYMVPVDESSSGGRPFEAYNKLRSVVPLSIARRDFEKSGVVVEYNPEKLYSGYYQIIAENPGNQKTFLDILVMANKEPVFDENQFAYFPNYEVHLLDTEKIKQNGNVLKIQGNGFSGETLFSLTPSTMGIPYPFASSKGRKKLDLSVSEIKALTQNGDVELSFKVNPDDIPPGYYNLTAENSMGKATKFLLVRDVEKESRNPEIVSAATSKGAKDSLQLELKGQNLKGEYVYTLVSQRSDFTGLSTRIPLNIYEEKKNGKKITLTCDREKISEGTYAILAESPENTVVAYIEINKKYKSKIVKLSEKEEKDLFIRPVNFVPSEEVEGGDAEQVPELFYSPNEFKTRKQYRVLFPYLQLDFSVMHDYWLMQNINPEINIYALGLNFEILNLKVFHLGAAARANFNEGIYSAESYINLSTSHQEFRPYVGFGAGVNIFDFNYKGSEYIVSSIINKKLKEDFPVGFYAFADAGVTLLNFLDVRYTMYYSGADRLLGLNFSNNEYPETGNYFYDDVTVGVKLPLGKLKRIQLPKNQTLTITKKGIASGLDYKLRKDIKKIVFSNGVTEIRDFNDNYMLTNISVPDTVRVIGKDAFKNCYQLKEVILPDGVVEIEAGAFVGCRSIQKIVLPSSIRKVDSSAFEDWEDFQYIVYQWSRDDTTVRDLGGLEYRANFTTVYDAMRTPFEKKDIFVSYNGEGARVEALSSRMREEGVEYIRTDLNMVVTKSDKNISYGGISTRDPMAMKYLKNGDGITFKYVGDGNQYSIIFTSRDRKTRLYYNFYTKKGAGEITIPYRNFIYDDHASKRFVKIKKMDIGNIQIESVWDDRGLGKNYKLSVYGIETIMEKKKK